MASRAVPDRLVPASSPRVRTLGLAFITRFAEMAHCALYRDLISKYASENQKTLVGGAERTEPPGGQTEGLRRFEALRGSDLQTRQD